MIKPRFRILERDSIFEYRFQAQIKYSWLPFWLNLGVLQKTEEDARALIERKKKFGSHAVIREAE